MDELLMDRRRVMMANQKPYIELEYIESSGTGTQWIDTGIIPNNDTKLNTKLSFTKQSLNYFALGCRTDGYNELSISNMALQYSYMCCIANGQNRTYSFTRKLYQPYTIEISNSYCKVDDDLRTNSANTLPSVTLYLGVMNRLDVSSLKEFAYCRYYSFKVRQSDILIQDLIPVIEKSTNEVCMYDLVTKQFFKNQGIGQFIAGPRK